MARYKWCSLKFCKNNLMNFQYPGDLPYAYLFLSGVLTTLVSLDREQQAEYELWVMVSDGQLSSVTPIFIAVSDVNDNPPEFLESLYRVTVPARSKTRKREALFKVRPDPDISVLHKCTNAQRERGKAREVWYFGWMRTGKSNSEILLKSW